MSEEEFKASHFKNIEELIKHCKMWINDDDYDAYCRFFDMGAMEELIKELDKEKEKNKLLIQGKFREVADKNSYIKDMYISKDKIKEKLKELKDIEQELTDEQGYWGSGALQEKIELLEELLEEE